MNPREPDWSLYRSFLAVLEEGSLSGAARRLGLTQPTIARHIEALEQSLGLKLFVRSQQGLSPTEGALELKPYALSLSATAAAMMRAASGQGTAVRGTVRVSAGEIVGAEILPPLFAGLRERHPELEIELVLSNAVDNLLRREADIAVRMVEPAQEALVVRRIGTITLGLHAHRRYLDRAGRPRRPDDLHTHSFIGFDRETPEIRSMRRRVEGLDDIHFSFRTDSDIAQLMAIRAGLGIGFCHVALARRDGDLERVLPAFQLKLGVWLAMHENLRSTPRCRAAFAGLAEGLMAYVD
ncbi:MAG: LysR family transcriptional regulator [Bradyrhizobiaceae bacterium]|nr:LysR family transcriptional regulator [Bradyrhizobiaceae bacterium]